MIPHTLYCERAAAKVKMRLYISTGSARIGDKCQNPVCVPKYGTFRRLTSYAIYEHRLSRTIEVISSVLRVMTSLVREV